MITVYTFGPAFAQADPSPFVVKTLTLMKMSGLEHKVEPADVRKAPKSKLPYINDDGQVIADSSFIKMHLEQAHGVDFTGGYDERDLAIGWSVEKMLEDHLYWIVVDARWMDDDNFNKGPRMFFDTLPAPARPLIVWMVRKEIRRNLWGHGLGRHTANELLQLAEKDFAALAAVLGDKPYLLGDRPCGFDASCYGFVSGATVPLFDHPTSAAAKKHPNLVAYCERMREEYFPELSQASAA
ncbi:MAG: glutathione S-transferase family protein [Alphaproteobacteria bacterium]|nr:glutathione S-transferase family protein [Alphaproteobacteria bacterium]